MLVSGPQLFVHGHASGHGSFFVGVREAHQIGILVVNTISLMAVKMLFLPGEGFLFKIMNLRSSPSLNMG
jgi:hypothetical protein